MREKANYGNWVPEKALYMLFGLAAVLLAAAIALGVLVQIPALTVTAGVLFVFHEVHSAKNKRQVVKEALRIVKKGGVFSFQDMFSQKALYGDMEEFVRELKAEGISEIHYIGNLEKKLDFIPGFVTMPWMISGMGILYGKK